MGAVTGAVAGGLLGKTIGKGNGRVAFTASRTFLGTVVGSEVEKSMDTPRTTDYANNPFVPTHQSPCDVCSGFTNECAKSSCKRGVAERLRQEQRRLETNAYNRGYGR